MLAQLDHSRFKLGHLEGGYFFVGGRGGAARFLIHLIA